jgi:hypothetical protein
VKSPPRMPRPVPRGKTRSPQRSIPHEEETRRNSAHTDGSDEERVHSDPEADNPWKAAIEMTHNIMELDDKGDEPKVTKEANVKEWIQHMLQYVTMKTLGEACKRNNIPNRYEAKPEKLNRIVRWCYEQVTE